MLTAGLPLLLWFKFNRWPLVATKPKADGYCLAEQCVQECQHTGSTSISTRRKPCWKHLLFLKQHFSHFLIRGPEDQLVFFSEVEDFALFLFEESWHKPLSQTNPRFSLYNLFISISVLTDTGNQIMKNVLGEERMLQPSEIELQNSCYWIHVMVVLVPS